MIDTGINPRDIALEHVCRHVGALLYGDCFDTPAPRFSHYTQALHALDDEISRLRREAGNGRGAFDAAVRNLTERL